MSRLVRYGSTDNGLVMLVGNASEGLLADFGREHRKEMRYWAGDGTEDGDAGDLRRRLKAARILRNGEKLVLSLDTADRSRTSIGVLLENTSSRLGKSG